MACMVGSMTLTNSTKEQIARRSAKTLVDLLSNPEGRTPSLRALHNLSCLDDNVTILVDSTILPAITNIMFEIWDSSVEQKELATAVIANLVSKPGQWELASAYKERNSLQSESIISSLLGLLSVLYAQCQLSNLQILYGITHSSHTSGSDDVKHNDDKESDGGSPASQDHRNIEHPFAESDEKEMEKREGTSSGQSDVSKKSSLEVEVSSGENVAT